MKGRIFIVTGSGAHASQEIEISSGRVLAGEVALKTSELKDSIPIYPGEAWNVFLQLPSQMNEPGFSDDFK